MNDSSNGPKDLSLNKIADGDDSMLLPKDPMSLIGMLSPKLKAVADKALQALRPPSVALATAQAQGQIDNLAPELKDVANRYLDKGCSQDVALKQALAQGKLNMLSNPGSIAVAKRCLARGESPVQALWEVKEYQRITSR